MKLVLYKMEGCGPCGLVQKKVDSVLAKSPEYKPLIDIVMVYEGEETLKDKDLHGFPVLVTLNEEGEEVNRLIGGVNILNGLRGALESLAA